MNPESPTLQRPKASLAPAPDFSHNADDQFMFRWRDAALILLASLISHLYTGFEYGLRAHAVQLARVNDLINPAIYPRDPFVDSLDQYCSYFWVAIAWLARWIDPFWSLLATHFLSRFALLFGIFCLAGLLFPARPVRYIALVLASLRLRAVLAGEVLLSPLPTHTTFTFPLLVWALVLAWQNRLLAGALLLGLACNLNLMTALPAAFVVLVSVLPDGLARNAAKGRPALRLVAAAAVWLIAAAPAIDWALRTPAPDIDSDHYYSLIRGIFWWHFDPLRWKATTYVQCAALVTLVCISLRFAPIATARPAVLAALAAIAFTWLAAILAAHVPPFFPLMKLQLARTATLAVALSIPLAAAAIHHLWRRRDRAALISLGLIAIAWGLTHSRTVAVILLCAGVAADALSPHGRMRQAAGRRTSLILATSLFAAVGLFSIRLIRQIADRDAAGLIIRTPNTAWRDVQDWAARHTRPDALFAGPVQRGGGFRIFSRRSYWLGFDFDAMLWRPDMTSDLVDRQERIRPTGLDSAEVTRVDWPVLQRLAAEEGIDFAVVPRSTLAEQTPIYANEKWAIVAMK